MKQAIFKAAIFTFFISGFVVVFFIAGIAIYSILIGDPCEYHNVADEDIPFIYRILYPMTPTSGFHPEPGLVHHILTLCLGVFGGIIASKWAINWIWRERNAGVGKGTS